MILKLNQEAESLDSVYRAAQVVKKIGAQMKVIDGPHEAKALEGLELPVTEWMEITQERIDRFADSTDDHNWIHVDGEKARTVRNNG